MDPEYFHEQPDLCDQGHSYLYMNTPQRQSLKLCGMTLRKVAQTLRAVPLVT